MHRFGIGGRALAALGAVAALAMVVVPGAEAQKVMEPGPFSIVPTAGSIWLRNTFLDLSPSALAECGDLVDNDLDTLADLNDPQCAAGPNGEPRQADNSELVAGFQPKLDVGFSGSIDADGKITIPVSGIAFPPSFLDVGGYVVTANVQATEAAVGSLDPLTGAANLRVRLRVQLDGAPYGVGMGYACGIGTAAQPIELNLTTGTSVSPTGDTRTGSPYNSTFGSLVVVNNNFSVPGATNCTVGLFANVNDIVNGNVGLPSPSGNNRADLRGTIVPPPKPGINVSMRTTALRGPAPHTVTFDASDSAVAKGPATYEWRFSDGYTTTGPVVTKTFANQGVATATVTVIDGDGDRRSRLENIIVDPPVTTTSTSTSTTTTSTTTTTTQPTTTTTTTQPTTTTTTQPTTTTTTEKPTTTTEKPTTTTTSTTTTTTEKPTTTTTTEKPTTTSTTTSTTEKPTTTTTTEKPTTTTEKPTTTTEKPTTTTSTTTTTTPPGDEVSVRIRGGTKYAATGELSGGNLVVESEGRSVVRLTGAGSIPGPAGGSARIGFNLHRLWFLDLWIGQVSVIDRSSGVYLVLPQVSRLPKAGGTVSGRASGIQYAPWPQMFAPVNIKWTVRDRV